jgi:adenylate cyclase class 2
MNDYKEHEIKVLDINVDKVAARLAQMGAKKVYDDIRTITTYDTPSRDLARQDKLVRITEEGTVKTTLHVHNSDPERKEVIKYKASGMEEQERLLSELGFFPIAKVRARRVSFELGAVDFDMDIFPAIPPFLEIDAENLMPAQIEEILAKLGLAQNKTVELGTEQIHSLYDVDYFTRYKI